MKSSVQDILQKFSTQKVELSLVETFIKEVDEAGRKSDDAIDEIIKVKSILKKAKEDVNTVISSIKTLKTGEGRIRKMYDELGVALDGKTSAAIKKRQFVEEEAEELIKKLNNLIATI